MFTSTKTQYAHETSKKHLAKEGTAAGKLSAATTPAARAAYLAEQTIAAEAKWADRVAGWSEKKDEVMEACGSGLVFSCPADPPPRARPTAAPAAPAVPAAPAAPVIDARTCAGAAVIVTQGRANVQATAAGGIAEEGPQEGAAVSTARSTCNVRLLGSMLWLGLSPIKDGETGSFADITDRMVVPASAPVFRPPAPSVLPLVISPEDGPMYVTCIDNG